MEQVPAAINEAVAPATVHTAGVTELKLTSSPELVLAANVTVELAGWAVIGEKLIVCCMLPVPTPLNSMLCDAATFRALSVNTSEPPKTPESVGAKLMGSVQDWPASSVPAEGPAVMYGHDDAPPVFNEKFAATLGLLPPLGTGKLRTAFPIFSTVTVFGLSLLVEPGTVGAKLKLGGSAKSSFRMRLFVESAI
jgi:hypothetical protein